MVARLLILSWMLLLSGALFLPACRSGKPAPQKNGVPVRVMGSPLSLERLIARRRSVRSFTRQPLTSKQVMKLLWAAQGITSPDGHRTCPSAGATFPLVVYAVTRKGVFRYQPRPHRLTRTRQGDLRQDLATAALGQLAVQEAPLSLVFAAIYARTEERYRERARRYVHLEAGHCAQNVLLQAVALDLGAVVLGAFTDHAVQKVLGLPEKHAPLYIIPIGHPRE